MLRSKRKCSTNYKIFCDQLKEHRCFRAKSFTVKEEQQTTRTKIKFLTSFPLTRLTRKPKITTKNSLKIFITKNHAQEMKVVLLQKLDISKSKDLDGIGNLILKQLSISLSVSLHSIFITHLDNGKHHSQWKKSFITPIYRGMKKTAIHSYKPQNSLSLSCPSKVCENVIFDDLFNCVNGQIHDSQYGLRPKRSTIK